MKCLERLLRHGFTLPWLARKYFPAQSLKRIEAEIAKSELKHLGEIRFVVESNLSFLEILRKKSAKNRALEIFSNLHIWDTEQNNGVLIYLLLADHDFEILADRGIHQHVGKEGWEAICQQMEAMFKKGEFELGVIFGIHQIGEALTKHFPANADKNNENVNELPNKPIIL
jgi:uncharacterized membrane protein